MENSSSVNAIMRTHRTIPFSRDEVYQAFEDPTRLAEWWRPNGFTNTFETFEFRPGGDWKFQMHGPDGHDYPNRSIFKELIPSERIVIEHISAPRFTLQITLHLGDSGTQILWESKFEDPQVAKAIRHIAEPGMEQTLDRLQLHLGGEIK